MTLQSGMGDALYVDAFHIGGDTSTVTIGSPLAVQDTTPITLSAMRRQGLRRDGLINYGVFWNPGAEADAAHNVVSTLPRTDRQVTYCRGTTLGAPAASMISKQINYDPNMSNDGSFTLAVNAVGSGQGLEWGNLATAGTLSLTAGDTVASVDAAAGTVHGARLYLHVLSFTGTSVFIGIDHSTDDDDTDPWAAIAAGALEQEVTAAGTFRTDTDAGVTIKQYTRLYASGTFSQVSFVANFVRNYTAVAA